MDIQLWRLLACTGWMGRTQQRGSGLSQHFCARAAAASPPALALKQTSQSLPECPWRLSSCVPSAGIRASESPSAVSPCAPFKRQVCDSGRPPCHSAAIPAGFTAEVVGTSLPGLEPGLRSPVWGRDPSLPPGGPSAFNRLTRGRDQPVLCLRPPAGLAVASSARPQAGLSDSWSAVSG